MMHQFQKEAITVVAVSVTVLSVLLISTSSMVGELKDITLEEEVTQMIEAPTAAIVTAIDPIGKDLTAVTAQIEETKIALQVLEGEQAQLQEDVTLRIGQVWTSYTKTDNPFDDNPERHFEITNIKNGYVAYNFILVSNSISITDSTDIKSFVRHYAKTLISE